MFEKICGMTGTADTEAEEFAQIYNLEVVQIPPHKKMIRDDKVDLVFLTEKEKYDRIINEIIEINKQSSPYLLELLQLNHLNIYRKYLNLKKYLIAY